MAGVTTGTLAFGLWHRFVSVCVPVEHNINAHILVDTSVELPDPLERNAVGYCETSMDQPFRNETVSDYDHFSCRFSVCKSLTCSDHQGGFSSLRA